jgi:hypothetical protein
MPNDAPAEKAGSAERARGGRGSSSLYPLIVARREVKQSSLGKLVCVLR